jgi:3-deoxy-manno-octulosonate cytidylyltransferase (CMP-KDO synthetase)
MNKQSVLGIIPARYASSRFPGKPLATILGVSMIERVYKQSLKASKISGLYVATDDHRIYNHVKSFGGNVLMTSPNHQSGTDRCLEAMQILTETNADCIPDVVVNIQGDEPLMEPGNLDAIIEVFQEQAVDIATLCTPFADLKSVYNTNGVKITMSKSNYALYFSRSVIPFVKNKENEQSLVHQFMKHVGVYAFRANVLRQICNIPPSFLETTESLEQLRWLENDFKIKTVVCESEGLCVDIPEDIQIVEQFLKNNTNHTEK